MKEQLKIMILTGLGPLERLETPLINKSSQGKNPRCSIRDEISQPSRPFSPRAATPTTHHSTGNGSRRQAKKRRRRSEEAQSGAAVVLPKEAAGVPNPKAARKQRAPLVYEELAQGDMDPNHRADGGVFRVPEEHHGKETVLMSALVVQHGDQLRLSNTGMDHRRRDDVAPVLGDRSLPVPATDIVAEAMASTIGEPTSDDELLAFAAEIELGGMDS